VKEAELTLLDFTPDYKVKEEVLKDIQETYTTYAVTKAEKDFHKRLEALVEAYNGIHSHLKGKGLTPNVMGFLMGRTDLEGIKVNTQAFKLISRSLNRS
jgi:tryptophan synthase beta subunit